MKKSDMSRSRPPAFPYRLAIAICFAWTVEQMCLIRIAELTDCFLDLKPLPAYDLSPHILIPHQTGGALDGNTDFLPEQAFHLPLAYTGAAADVLDRGTSPGS